jgi:hypothetical protein
LVGASSNTLLISTQQVSRQQLVHRKDANAATYNMTHDQHLKFVSMTGPCTNTTQHGVGCEYICIIGNNKQLTI